MPVSSPLCKKDIMNWIVNNVPKDASIMDVGPGCGTYSDILRPLGYKYIDAIEIYEPYIEKYSLRSKYNRVILGNAVWYSFYDEHDFVILGDVLEHMSYEDGKRLVTYLQRTVKYILISVPYANTQGEYDGNIYETHLQNDLCAETFTKYYPGFTMISDEEDKGRHNDLGEWEHITAWVWKREV
jgi:2-polyprenyl-3-methyl-5-hydroxy-6-metoxy-1,4-benzoquinol methylase